MVIKTCINVKNNMEMWNIKNNTIAIICNPGRAKGKKIKNKMVGEYVTKRLPPFSRLISLLPHPSKIKRHPSRLPVLLICMNTISCSHWIIQNGYNYSQQQLCLEMTLDTPFYKRRIRFDRRGTTSLKNKSWHPRCFSFLFLRWEEDYLDLCVTTNRNRLD